MKKNNRLALAIAVLVIGPTGIFKLSHAQTPPNIGDALRQVQPTNPPIKAEPVLPSIGNVPQTIEAPMGQLLNGPQLAVSKLTIVGNRVIDNASLETLVADGAGKNLSLAELEELAGRVTKYYRFHGYFVARAYVPEQRVIDGVVKIRVVEGNYGEFYLKNQSLVNDKTVQSMLDDIKDADIVSLDTLERAMLIINDTPGVQVTRADVMPGNKVGTSDFAVDTVATAKYAGNLTLDNFGSIYTGRDRFSFNLDDNELSGYGDRLSLSGMATDAGGLQNGRVGYQILLAPNGLRGELAYSQTRYQLGDTYANLDATGTAKGLDAILTYPLRRTHDQSIELSADLSNKNLDDKIDATQTDIPKTTKSGTFGIAIKDQRVLFGADGLTQASLKVTFGQLAINQAEALAQDQAGAKTEGNYNKLNLDALRTSALPDQFVLIAEFKMQHTLTDKNLDSSERMAVSGYGAVLAFPPGELIGADADLVHFELARPFPVFHDVQSQWQLFTDWGDARQASPIPTDTYRHISDVGIGWTAYYQGASLRAYLAHRVDSTPAISEPYPDYKFLVQLAWAF